MIDGSSGAIFDGLVRGSLIEKVTSVFKFQAWMLRRSQQNQEPGKRHSCENALRGNQPGSFEK